MTLLDRYLGWRMLSAFLKATAGLVALYVVFDLLTHRSGQIIERDVPWAQVGLYYLAQIPFVISEYQLAALATLVSGLLVFGTAAQRNEIVAALSAGVSLRRIVLGPAIVVMLICAAVLAVQETIGIAAAKTSFHIEDKYYMGAPKADRPGISWTNLAGGWSCHVLKFNREANTGETVIMLRYGPGVIERIQAKRIYWDDRREAWLLEDGLWSRFDPEQEMQSTHQRITQIEAPLHEAPGDLFALDAEPSTQTIPELQKDIERAKTLGLATNRAEVHLHTKYARPFLPFVMLWLAAPFALRIRRGGVATAFGISIAVGLTYLIAFVLVQNMGYFGHLPPLAAAWTPNAIFLALGLTLFIRTPT